MYSMCSIPILSNTSHLSLLSLLLSSSLSPLSLPLTFSYPIKAILDLTHCGAYENDKGNDPRPSAPDTVGGNCLTGTEAKRL